jgi:hypothetical protein
MEISDDCWRKIQKAVEYLLRPRKLLLRKIKHFPSYIMYICSQRLNLEFYCLTSYEVIEENISGWQELTET